MERKIRNIGRKFSENLRLFIHHAFNSNRARLLGQLVSNNRKCNKVSNFITSMYLGDMVCTFLTGK